jgi:hypothetical protein
MTTISPGSFHSIISEIFLIQMLLYTHVILFTHSTYVQIVNLLNKERGNAIIRSRSSVRRFKMSVICLFRSREMCKAFEATASRKGEMRIPW